MKYRFRMKIFARFVIGLIRVHDDCVDFYAAGSSANICCGGWTTLSAPLSRVYSELAQRSVEFAWKKYLEIIRYTICRLDVGIDIIGGYS